MEPLGVGLHILYGRMGGGKTNFAVNEILTSTTYKKCILNVPLFSEFEETLNIEFEKFKKLEPEKVIRKIDDEHTDTIFIVDESQMVLLSANKLMVDSFVKKMSQIRQNNQCVIVIAQISKMLPASIKDLAESCFFFENNNVKGREKSSHVKHYRTGYDYSTRLIEEFTFIHKYGNYETSNTPTTEKPKNLYKRTYIKIALVFAVAAALFVFVGVKFYSFFHKDKQSNSLQTNSVQSNLLQTNLVQSNSIQSNDTLCVRSWVHLGHGIVNVMFSNGQMEYVPIIDFSRKTKCSL